LAGRYAKRALSGGRTIQYRKPSTEVEGVDVAKVPCLCDLGPFMPGPMLLDVAISSPTIKCLNNDDISFSRRKMDNRASPASPRLILCHYLAARMHVAHPQPKSKGPVSPELSPAKFTVGILIAAAAAERCCCMNSAAGRTLIALMWWCDRVAVQLFGLSTRSKSC